MQARSQPNILTGAEAGGRGSTGPVLMGFTGDAEAKCFYGQAASEVGVIAATDWG